MQASLLSPAILASKINQLIVGGIDFIIIKIIERVNKALKLFVLICLLSKSKFLIPVNSILIRCNPIRPNIRGKIKLIKSGCIKENSLGIIDGILDAEFSGIKSHGFHYLPVYCNHLRIGKINGNASPKLEQISSSSIKVNADNGFAHTAINMGLKLLCEMSKNEGISCMSVNNSYNCGVLGFHTKRIAEKNLIGIDFTNAPASIAPIGSTKPVIGTNPYSIAAPQNGEVLIIIDQSASVVAKSEISVRAKLDEPIPEGWAFDKDGNVTTNAKDALKGTMAPTGGYKGFGAGLMVEILASCVAGGNLGTRASSFAGEDGKTSYGLQSALRLEDGDWVQSMTDITQIKIQQQELKRLSDGIENLANPIFIWDFENKLFFFNQAAEKTNRDYWGIKLHKGMPRESLLSQLDDKGLLAKPKGMSVQEYMGYQKGRMVESKEGITTESKLGDDVTLLANSRMLEDGSYIQNFTDINKKSLLLFPNQ